MSRWLLSVVMALAVVLTLGGQDAASAASERIKAPSIGMDASVVKVGVKNGDLAIGGNVRVVYTWKAGDPPCDPTGSTVYTGHAWKAGDGIADEWGSLTRGNLITVAGCQFKVTKRAYWSKKKVSKKMKSLHRVDGSPRIVLIGCKPSDYSKRTMVFARLVS